MRRERGPRIFLAGGGTGGHLYPGLALAEALTARAPEVALAFACTERPIDRFILDGCRWPVTALSSRPFRAGAPWTWPGFVLGLVRAGNQARRRLREFCPDVVVGLGGYGSYAPVRVGQKYGVATAVLNPDIVLGRANRRLLRRADRVFCQFEETLAEVGDRGRLTGCPVRPSLLGADRAEAMRAFGLDPQRRTLLVTGASLGARTVNRAVVAMFRGGAAVGPSGGQEGQSPGGLPPGWQVLHLTGHADYGAVAAAYRDLGVPAVVRPFAQRMGLVYAAADLAVARAGASTIAELLAVGVPAVFMPYPFHRDQHQQRQARAVEAVGAAVVVEDRPDDPAGTARRLAEAVRALAKDEPRRRAMARAAAEAGRPDAADAVAREVLALAEEVIRRRHAVLATGPGAGGAAADVSVDAADAVPRGGNDRLPPTARVDRNAPPLYTRPGDLPR